MMTWTINTFDGHYPVGTAAVVTSESVEMAVIWLEKELDRIGIPQKIKNEDLIPMVTSSRNVRILSDGNY